MNPILIAAPVLFFVALVAGLVLIRKRQPLAESQPKNPGRLRRFLDARAARRMEKAKKELDEIKSAAAPPDGVPSPPAVPDQDSLQQYPIPRKMAIELTRVKEGKGRVTVRTGFVTLIPRFQKNKDMFWFWVSKRGYFIDPARTIKVKVTKGVRHKQTVEMEKLVYDVFNSEPLDSKGNITFSYDVEHLWRDSALDQYITVVTFESGFQMTAGLAKAIVVVGILAFILGMALNGAIGITPKEITHFVP